MEVVKNMERIILEKYGVNNISQLEEVKEFEKRYYSDIMKDKYHHDLLASNFIYSINDKSVGVTSLNTVWRYNDESKCKNKIIFNNTGKLCVIPWFYPFFFTN